MTHTASNINAALQIRLALHADAPTKWQERWCAIKSQCETGENSSIVSAWSEELDNRHIGDVTDRNILNRVEGGIGGDSNAGDRQIRFSEVRHTFALRGRMRCTDDRNDIVLVAYPSEDGQKQWTVEELMDGCWTRP